MTFYADMADTAADMINEFGQAVTLTATTAGAYDPATGTYGAGSSTTQTVRAVETQSRAQTVGGVLVVAGDKMLMLSPLTTAGAAVTTPSPEDRCTMAGTTYTIKAVEPYSPGGTVLYITVLLRR